MLKASNPYIVVTAAACLAFLPGHRAGAASGQIHSRKSANAAHPSIDWRKRFIDITTHEDVTVREEMLRELAGDMSDDQVIGAIDDLSDAKSGLAKIFIVYLGERWAERSPSTVAAWAMIHTKPDIYGRNLFAGIMVPWAHQNLNAAVTWVEHMPANANRGAAAISLANEASAMGKAPVAAKVVSYVPAGADRNNATSYIAQQWAITDRSAAVAWIGKLRNAALRERILGAIAVNLAAQDPAAGARFAAMSMDPGAEQDTALARSVRFWSAVKPADAAAWSKRLSSTHLRVVAAAAVADTGNR